MSLNFRKEGVTEPPMGELSSLRQCLKSFNNRLGEPGAVRPGVGSRLALPMTGCEERSLYSTPGLTARGSPGFLVVSRIPNLVQRPQGDPQAEAFTGGGETTEAQANY